MDVVTTTGPTKLVLVAEGVNSRYCENVVYRIATFESYGMLKCGDGVFRRAITAGARIGLLRAFTLFSFCVIIRGYEPPIFVKTTRLWLKMPRPTADSKLLESIRKDCTEKPQLSRGGSVIELGSGIGRC